PHLDPPSLPSFPTRRSSDLFAVTPIGSSPSTFTARSPCRFCGRHCVASTSSTSEVPIPKASAPKAPCVEVCESPQTISIPGWVRSEEHTSELQSLRHLVCRL